MPPLGQARQPSLFPSKKAPSTSKLKLANEYDSANEAAALLILSNPDNRRAGEAEAFPTKWAVAFLARLARDRAAASPAPAASASRASACPAPSFDSERKFFVTSQSSIDEVEKDGIA